MLEHKNLQWLQGVRELTVYEDTIARSALERREVEGREPGVSKKRAKIWPGFAMRLS